MALLLPPRFLICPISSRKQVSSYSSFIPASYGAQRTRFPRAASSSMTFVKMSVGTESDTSTGPAILWYKHDLRIDDHPGLVAASRHPKLLPLYIFERRILARFSDEILKLLLVALHDLRKSLKDQGSNLMVRFGNAESVIGELVKEVKATTVYTEEEIEYTLRAMFDSVKEVSGITSCSTSSTNEFSNLVVWNTPFYNIKDLENMPISYNNFKKLKLPVIPPILPPVLPGAIMELAWGDLPTLDDLRKFVANDYGTLKQKWTQSEDILSGDELQTDQASMLSTAVGGVRSTVGKSQIVATRQNYRRKRPDNSVFVTQGYLVGGGTSTVLNALAAYLRYLEGTALDEWQEVHEKLRELESREGASFGFLFGPALLLGVVSRRRVHYEAIKYEKERNAGFLSPFGYSAVTIAAAVETVCSMEWYSLLALRSTREPGGIFPVRIWRWNGFLIHYTVVGHEGPPVLLVHGFGAFLEHYRDNISHVAEGGNRVWAMTLLGFGRSEKPNLVYTELIWGKVVRDFIIEVIGEPVHLVGNSIGGYFAAIVAKLWPSLAKSTVLLNSSGNMIPGYSAAQFAKNRQIVGAAGLGARLLLLYLRSNLRNIVKNFYPSNSNRADDWLISEMLRASHDPGVLVVLECIFSFDLSVPLNYLLEGCENKVLFIQGMRDPLTNSRSKVDLLKACVKGIVIREIAAGHCPHDELPFEVNSIIQDWIIALERRALTATSPSGRSVSIDKDGGMSKWSTS